MGRTQSSRARFNRPRFGPSSAGAHTQLSTCSQWLALVDAALLSTSRLATAFLTSSPSAVSASSSTRSRMPSLPKRPCCHSECPVLLFKVLKGMQHCSLHCPVLQRQSSSVAAPAGCALVRSYFLQLCGEESRAVS